MGTLLSVGEAHYFEEVTRMVVFKLITKLPVANVTRGRCISRI